MALSKADLSEIIHDDVLPAAKSKWAQNNLLSKQLGGLVTKTWTPAGVDAEYSDFLRKSRSPLLDFAAQCIAQGLVIDAHSNPKVWEEAWQAAGMDGRQSALNYQAVAYGYGYLLSFPGDPDGVVMRPLSVHSTFSTKADPWDDELEFVLHRVKPGKKDGSGQLWRFFDDECMYEIKGRPDQLDGEIVPTEHGLGVNPVTLIQSQFAMDGLPASVVEPGLQAYKRVVDATFTLKMVERYGMFPQKWQAGGVMGVDEQGNALVRPSVDSILHTEEYEAKFGTFAATDMDKAVAAVDHHMQQLAAVLQLPPHYLLGKVVNLSSDALAATETGYSRRIKLLQESMGEGYERALRVAAACIGDEKAAADMAAEVHWTDTSVRSLAQVADAVQKLDAVGADRELLFKMVPGWSAADAQAATRIALYRDKNQPSNGDAVTATAVSPGTSTDSREGE